MFSACLNSLLRSYVPEPIATMQSARYYDQIPSIGQQVKPNADIAMDSRIGIEIECSVEGRQVEQVDLGPAAASIPIRPTHAAVCTFYLFPDDGDSCGRPYSPQCFDRFCSLSDGVLAIGDVDYAECTLDAAVTGSGNR